MLPYLKGHSKGQVEVKSSKPLAAKDILTSLANFVETIVTIDFRYDKAL